MCLSLRQVQIHSTAYLLCACGYFTAVELCRFTTVCFRVLRFMDFMIAYFILVAFYMIHLQFMTQSVKKYSLCSWNEEQSCNKSVFTVI